MGDNSFSEAFKELDALYTDDLIEAYGDFYKARVVTTYKGYDIYHYLQENKPVILDDKGIPQPYSDRYYAQDSRGQKLAVGTTSVEDCKKNIDGYLRDVDYEARRKKAQKLVDTTAATYRGCSIYYKYVVDPDKGLYTYYVGGNTKTAGYVVSDIDEKTFKSIDAAKKAIDQCIREWNSYADTGDEYKESLRRFIRESLAQLDA